MSKAKVEEYTDSDGAFRMKVVSSNGNILIATTEGYARKIDAKKAMKTAAVAIIKSLFCLAVLFISIPATAQTNTPPDFYGKFMGIAEDLGKAPWSIVTGYGRGLKGNKSVAFGALAYNFNENVGIILGEDYLWRGNSGFWNNIKGGITLQLKAHPFAFIGSTPLTNVVATPFVTECVATPRGSANLGNVMTAGVNFEVYAFANFAVDLGVQMENRVGQDYYSGNYLLGHVGLTRKF
jgi:uncharacterized protein YegP (UPF0339 family)